MLDKPHLDSRHSHSAQAGDFHRSARGATASATSCPEASAAARLPPIASERTTAIADDMVVD